MPCMSCTLRGLLEFGTCYWLRKISNHALVGWPHCDRYFAHCFGTTLSAWYQNHTGGTLCELPRQTVVMISNEDPWRIKEVIFPIWGSERGAIRIGWSIGPREGRNHLKMGQHVWFHLISVSENGRIFSRGNRKPLVLRVSKLCEHRIWYLGKG